MNLLKNRITNEDKDSEPVFWSMLALLCVIFAVLVFSGCSSTAARQGAVSGADAEDCTHIESLGIRINGVHLSAAGSMLDFRYRVVDAAKAAPLFERKIRPYLLDESSGAAFGVPESPKLGQMRTTRRDSAAAEERDYHILFANPGHVLRPGQKVSLVIGDTKLENLLIR
ncbi:MAG: hypothetical protein WC029_02750 [Sulfuricella sp.]